MGACTSSNAAYAAGLTASSRRPLAACGASSSRPAPSVPPRPPAAAASAPLAAVQLAAKTSDGANSFTGTMSLQATAKPGRRSGAATPRLTASFAEQLRPSLLAEVERRVDERRPGTLPGGMTEVLTPGTLYMKWPYLTQLLHPTKPWVTISCRGSKSSGVNLSQIFSQASSSSPLTESQLLGGATSVRKVGTGTVGGVPVTEYTGTLSLDKGLSPQGSPGRVQKEFPAAGITTATFTVWIDGPAVAEVHHQGARHRGERDGHHHHHQHRSAGQRSDPDRQANRASAQRRLLGS